MSYQRGRAAKCIIWHKGLDGTLRYDVAFTRRALSTRAVVVARSLDTLAEAVAARDAYEEANPPGTAGSKPGHTRVYFDGLNTYQRRMKLGLCPGCGGEKDKHMYCLQCRRARNVKEVQRHRAMLLKQNAATIRGNQEN